MAKAQQSFTCGVVEGFYGKPWNARQRHQLFTWMKQWGMNTYLYAPKDDLKHRSRWRDLYSEVEVAELAALIRDCRRHDLDFIYAIAPGLDMRYCLVEDQEKLSEKIKQVHELGCGSFALLFDDIPSRLSAEDAKGYSSFEAAHTAVTNKLFEYFRGVEPNGRFLFCPTPYCGQMAAKNPDYLPYLGEHLDPNIEVLWTGPLIVSEQISVESIRELRSWIKRKPLIWDNLHANDYDHRRIYLGPYSGRAPELRQEISGILSNPNCQFEANFVPLRTLALYHRNDGLWNDRLAYIAAQREWIAAFQFDRSDSISQEDLELLGDLFYLPYEHGRRGQQLFENIRRLLHTRPSDWGEVYSQFIQTVDDIFLLFAKLGELRNRDLLFALYPFLWEMKEEMALLRGYVDWVKNGSVGSFKSDEHRPKTYRGGLAAELQRLLPMEESGCFTSIKVK